MPPLKKIKTITLIFQNEQKEIMKMMSDIKKINQVPKEESDNAFKKFFY